MASLREFFGFGRSQPKEQPLQRDEEVFESECKDEQQSRNPYSEVFQLTGHQDCVEVLLKIDDRRVFTAAQDKSAIIWDTKTGRILHSLEGHRKHVTCACVLDESVFLDEQSSSSSLLTDSTDDKPRGGGGGGATGGGEEHRANTPTRRFPVALVTASVDGTIMIWDLISGKHLKTQQEHQRAIKSMMVMQCHVPVIATAGQDICIWSKAFQLLYEYQRDSEDYVHSMIAIKDHRIVVASDKPYLMVYQLSWGTINDNSSQIQYRLADFKKLPSHRETITCLKVISDAIFASASQDGTIIIWTSHRLSVPRKFNCHENYYDQVTRALLFPVQNITVLEQRFIVASIGNGFSIFDSLTDRPALIQKKLAHQAPVTSVCLLESRDILATCSQDGHIKLWAVPLKEYQKEWSLPYPDDRQEATNYDGPLSKFFKTRVKECRNLDLALELIGLCSLHLGAVKELVECGEEGFISCGTDGALILWKDSNLQNARANDILSQIFEGTGWMEH